MLRLISIKPLASEHTTKGNSRKAKPVNSCMLLVKVLGLGMYSFWIATVKSYPSITKTDPLVDTMRRSSMSIRESTLSLSIAKQFDFFRLKAFLLMSKIDLMT